MSGGVCAHTAVIFGGIFLSKADKRFYVMCGIIAALVLALIVLLTKVDFSSSSSGSTGSTAASEAASGSTSSVVSAYGEVASFDYENFTYSDGLDENGYWDGINALDYVTLPEDYASISVAKADVEPGDDDVQTQLDSLLSQNATTTQITDRAAESGDTVNIDYSGSVDGVAFTGGTATGYDLTLGSGTFIDGFEDQIVGHTPGESFDITVTFPDSYGDSTDSEGNTVTLSGKEAVFAITLNYISETVTPELTDEWVDATYGESDDLHTADELRARLSELLYENNLKNYVIEYLLENSTFAGLPKAVTDYQVKQCLNYYYTMASYYGYDLDTFAQSVMGYDSTDAMLATMDSSIETYSKEALLYQAVAEAMGLAPTQEQIDVYADYVETYGQNYCTMAAMMDAVTEALMDGAQVA